MTRCAPPKSTRLRATLALCALLSIDAATARHAFAAQNPLDSAYAALRTLQFSRALDALGGAAKAGNTQAQYLLGLMYLNGVGVQPDDQRARALLTQAGEHGHGAAAYVLSAELTRDPRAPPGAAAQWLQRAAQLGYARATEALRGGKPLLAPERIALDDEALYAAWALECARKNDAQELSGLGAKAAHVDDAFGRGALAYAAESNSLEAAKALLDLGAQVGAADRVGTTPLMSAAMLPGDAMTRLLLAHQADAQALDAEGRSALNYAARANRPANVTALASAGARLESRDARGYNALDAARAVGASEAAAALRSVGLRASVSIPAEALPEGKFDPARAGALYRGWPPIGLAVARNDPVEVARLLDAGASAAQPLPDGLTLLEAAADARALASIPALLEHGADPGVPDRSGHTVLWSAVTRGDLPLVQALLAAGVKPDTHAAEEIPLIAAARAQHADIAQALLSAGASVDAADASGLTALMLAVRNHQQALSEMLLARHPALDARDHDGRSALWYAAASGATGEVKSLLQLGAIPAPDSSGAGVLHAAASQPSSGVLEPLIAARTDLNARTANGDSALMIASAAGREEIVQALLTHSPDLNVQNRAGDTALILASRGGYGTVCHQLLVAGANRALRNRAGTTAADIAASRGFAAIASEILGKGG